MIWCYINSLFLQLLYKLHTLIKNNAEDVLKESKMFGPNKSLGTDQILAKLIQAGGITLCSEIQKLINSIWNMKELPQQWRESIIVPIYKKNDKMDCSNYRAISLLPTIYKILSSILLSRLTPYINEITGDYQCGFKLNRSPTDQIFCIHQILEKKWEYNGTAHQLFIDFKKVYNINL
jgi:hypothetical protein